MITPIVVLTIILSDMFSLEYAVYIKSPFYRIVSEKRGAILAGREKPTRLWSSHSTF